MIQRLDRAFGRVAWFMAALAGLALVTLAVIILTEVLLRNIGIPFIGAIELVRVVFVITSFFAFAHVITGDREIRVDVLRYLFPERVSFAFDAIASFITLAFFALLVWFAFGRTHEAVVRGIYLEGRLLIPMWIPWGTITLGSALAVIASLRSIVRYLAAAFGAAPPAIAADSGLVRDPEQLI